MVGGSENLGGAVEGGLIGAMAGVTGAAKAEIAEISSERAPEQAGQAQP